MATTANAAQSSTGERTYTLTESQLRELLRDRLALDDAAMEANESADSYREGVYEDYVTEELDNYTLNA